MTWRLALVSMFGLGLLRPAPGTWGSLPPCVLAALLAWLGMSATTIDLSLAAVLAAACIGCIALGGWAERARGDKDPSVVVIDETAGMALALLFVPLDPLQRGSLPVALVIIGAAFVLFRLLDIVKPPPANVIQQFPRGWGILSDDLVAGLYANLILQAFLRLGLPALTS